MGWKAFHSGTSTQSAGVGILINPKSNIKPAVAAHEIIPGRAMAITLKWEGVEITVASVYLTSGSNERITRQTELQTIEGFVTSMAQGEGKNNIIFGGDRKSVV